eukprot:574775-Amphidinium_carterae.1
MTDDVRAIDDAEALTVWSELSELDPKLRGDTYVTEDAAQDGSQWNFGDLVDDLRVMRERAQRSAASGDGWAQLESEQQKLKLTTARGRLEQQPQT